MMARRTEPVRFTLDESGLTIEATLTFCPRCLEAHPRYGVTYADLIEAGIRRTWTTALPLDEKLHPALIRYREHFWPEVKIPEAGTLFSLRTILYRHPSDTYGHNIPPGALPIRLARSTLLPSRVGSPFWRRGWGFFRVFQLEGLGLNWMRHARGRMTMAPYDYVWQIEPVAAHEFGHLLGLGDAYGAIYRYYFDAPDTAGYLMRSNGALSPEELAMVLEAERLNRMQFFPKSFSAKQFRAGFKKEVERLKKQADRR